MSMAATTHQLQVCETVEKDCKVLYISRKDIAGQDSCRNFLILHKNLLFPRHLVLKYEVTGDLLWMLGWVGPVQTCRELDSNEDAVAAIEIDSFVNLLKDCIGAKDLLTGSSIHTYLAERGLLELCSDAVITMYATCGEIGKAKALLDVYSSKDVIAWTALMSSYVNEGQGEEALDLFKQMQNQDILPSAITYVCALKACAISNAIGIGKQIHYEIARQGLLHTNILLGGALVDMYVKCQAVSEAWQVFNVIPFRTVVTWNAMIAGFSQDGDHELALNCLEEMQCEGTCPSAVTYICLLKACTMMRAVDKGKQIHSSVTRLGLLKNNLVLGSSLVGMYAKCCYFSEAHWVFEIFPCRDVALWNALISGYSSEEGEAEQALNCLKQMCDDGFLPNAVTYVCALKACAMIKAADQGMLIHDVVAKQGLLHDNIVVGGALVDMYAKCASTAEARQVLEGLPFRNAVAWNALLAGYVQEGEVDQALNCIREMDLEGVEPNAATYVSALKACAMIRGADRGEQIHLEIVRKGLLQKDTLLDNALVDMYAKCGIISDARRLFNALLCRDSISWNVLMAGYADGDAEQALKCFVEMQNEGILPDAVTYAVALKSCATIGAANRGKGFHNELVKKGLLQDNIILGSALEDMYAKCGDILEARWAFEELRIRDIVTWNALIAAYAQEGEGEQALHLVEQMSHEGILPDTLTYVYALKACALTKAADKGRKFHIKINVQDCSVDNVLLGNALVEMYAKCGNISEALWVFENLPSRDVISWNALVAFYVEKGQAEEALKCFGQMEHEGTLPNAVTYSCVLILCSHQGLIEEGQRLFANMCSKYGLNSSVECCTSMIDLYGRAGHLANAVRFMQEMPSSGFTAVWHALLGSCWNWEDINVGGWAFEQATNLDHSDGPAYVLMSNLYAAGCIKYNRKCDEIMKIHDKSSAQPEYMWQINSSNHVYKTESVQDLCTDGKVHNVFNKIPVSESHLLVTK